MPQKLIRLTCESNDGVFNGIFDQDITIKRDSEIALQSLTLERTSTSFDVNNSNNTITFNSKQPTDTRQVATLTPGIYRQADRDLLVKDINLKMNAVCDFITTPAQMNVAWAALVNDVVSDNVEITCRPSPFFPLACFNPLTTAPMYNTEVERGVPVREGVADAVTPVIGTNGMTRAITQSVVGNLNECYMFSQYPFIKSTGSFRVRLSDVTEGTDNRACFTIGLTDTDGLAKLRDATITLADLVYAIQVDQRAAPAETDKGGYSFVTKKGETVTEDMVPYLKIDRSALATKNTNDVMEITIGNGKLQGFIHQHTGATKRAVTASAALEEGVDLYPVVFWHLASITTPSVKTYNLDMIQCSFYPFRDYVGTIPDVAWENLQRDNQQLEPETDELTTTVKYDDGSQEIPFAPNIRFESNGIANHLGYTEALIVEAPSSRNPRVRYDGIGGDAAAIRPNRFVDPNTGQAYDTLQGVIVFAPNVFLPSVDNESFLVETQTFQLDSYDSYGLTSDERNANAGGSRRNLLASIPVIETPITNAPNNTRVLYQPNTLDYIAIKNRSDMITRQIRLRLLNSRYGSITTAGLAAMTVLIRDPD